MAAHVRERDDAEDETIDPGDAEGNAKPPRGWTTPVKAPSLETSARGDATTVSAMHESGDSALQERTGRDTVVGAQPRRVTRASARNNQDAAPPQPVPELKEGDIQEQLEEGKKDNFGGWWEKEVSDEWKKKFLVGKRNHLKNVISVEKIRQKNASLVQGEEWNGVEKMTAVEYAAMLQHKPALNAFCEWISKRNSGFHPCVEGGRKQIHEHFERLKEEDECWQDLYHAYYVPKQGELWKTADTGFYKTIKHRL